MLVLWTIGDGSEDTQAELDDWVLTRQSGLKPVDASQQQWLHESVVLG